MLVARGGKVHTPGGLDRAGHIDGLARARARSMLLTTIPFADTAPQDAVAYATHLEACAVAFAQNKYESYMRIVARVVYNLRTNGKVIVARHPVSRVCKLTHKLLRSETAHALRDAHVERRVMALQARAENEADRFSRMAQSIKTSQAAKCPQCHTQDGIIRITAQLNRGDEGMQTQWWCSRGCQFKWNSK